MQVMEWLEQLNVVHLDLKPANCIRTKAGQLKLCDAAGLMRTDAGEPSAALSGAFGEFHKLCRASAICCCMHLGLVSCIAVLEQNIYKHGDSFLLQTWQRSASASTSQTT